MRKLLIALVLCCASGCASMRHDTSKQVVHVVVVWLKEPGNELGRQDLIDTARDFQGRIPGLLRVQGGRALPNPGPMVDGSFDVALVMTFRDEKALADYQTHPVHVQALKEVLTPLAGKVVIYDMPDRH